MSSEVFWLLTIAFVVKWIEWNFVDFFATVLVRTQCILTRISLQILIWRFISHSKWFSHAFCGLHQPISMLAHRKFVTQIACIIRQWIRTMRLHNFRIIPHLRLSCLLRIQLFVASLAKLSHSNVVISTSLHRFQKTAALIFLMENLLQKGRMKQLKVRKLYSTQCCQSQSCWPKSHIYAVFFLRFLHRLVFLFCGRFATFFLLYFFYVVPKLILIIDNAC